jgi:hypothetical protein
LIFYIYISRTGHLKELEITFRQDAEHSSLRKEEKPPTHINCPMPLLSMAGTHLGEKQITQCPSYQIKGMTAMMHFCERLNEINSPKGLQIVQLFYEEEK